MTDRLPKDFLRRKQLLPEKEWEQFLQSFQEPRTYGLRLGLRTSCQELPFSLEPIPWARNGYYFDPDQHPGRHPLHEAGAYYIQEPSAMSAVTLLDPQPGETVCDLCAAPGGKSTQIAEALRGQGLLLCNDPSPARARILSQNIERMGIANALVCNESPEYLAARFPGIFHRVIVDAPCSGEGMFRRDQGAVREWSLENVISCARRQKMILGYADQMLQPGGIMVYSTCTFSLEENEEVIAWFLQTHTDYTLVDWRETALGWMVSGTPDHAALSGGILCCAEQMPTLPDRAPGSDDPRISREYTPSPDNGIYQSLSGALRLWPHRLKGEGHFAARLQKARTSHPQDRPGKPAFPDRRAERIPYQQLSISYAHAHKKKREKRTSSLRADGLKEYQDFIADHLTDRHIKKGSSCRLERYGDNLFQLPGLAPSLSGIKVLRPGLHLGLIRKNRFEPAHALARALTADQVRRSVSCSLEDAIRYLAGQTLSCGHDLKGWTLVCYQGHSLGWGKAQGGTLKNHYPKGLRRRTG